MRYFNRVVNFCRKIIHQPIQTGAVCDNHTLIPRDQHTISRKDISENALKVLYRLNKAGYEAYLVGGSVRDLLLGKKPKDFDITTNATPEQVKKLFRNCRLIGRRFRLAHIMFGPEIIEVATFRGAHSETVNSKQSETGMLLRDNVYGKTIDEDALRRDFSINGLYYSVADFTVRDYTGGLADLKRGIIRLIGDPEVRYREDPVRMLRAVRFAAKLGMTIEPKTSKPIEKLADLLTDIPSARLFDESVKLLQTGNGYATYRLLRQYHLFKPLFPLISSGFTPAEDSNLERILIQVLKNTDYRIEHQMRVNPAFLFAVMLWYPLVEHANQLSNESGLPYHDSFALAINEILANQCKTLAIPKRLTSIMMDIWQLQLRLTRRQGKRAFKLLEHPKFRAAYDLLELRSSIEKGELLNLAKWWDAFQSAPAQQQQVMVNKLGRDPNDKVRRGRRNYKRPRIKQE